MIKESGKPDSFFALRKMGKPYKDLPMNQEDKM